jgi:hypothetical protein
MFVEGNVVLPFYRVTSQRYPATQPGSPVVSHRYAPSVVVSVGLGWQRSATRGAAQPTGVRSRFLIDNGRSRG